MNSSIVLRNTTRRSAPFWSAAVLSAGLLSASAVMAADAPAATAPDSWPVTSWGVPDVQGIFDYSSRTGVERQPQFEGRLTISQEEAERLVQACNNTPMPLRSAALKRLGHTTLVATTRSGSIRVTGWR